MYETINFEKILGTPGLSDNLLKNHFVLYEGYVKNIDMLNEKLGTLAKDAPEFSELKRRFGWEWDGMRLHEYYFENIAKEGFEADKDSDFFKKITEDFGSFENWEADFKSTGKMRGIGWVILYFDFKANKLFDVWINEHDGGHLAGCVPILVMDVFEHAYMIDYGTKKPDYIEAFWKAIDWNIVERRFTDPLIC